jgi:hypothetical protein
MYFYAAHEAIFRSKDQGFEYVKTFGDQLNDWIDIFANSGCEDYGVLDAVVRLI